MVLPLLTGLGSLMFGGLGALSLGGLNTGTSDLSTDLNKSGDVGDLSGRDTTNVPTGLVSWVVDNRKTEYTDNTQTTNTDVDINSTVTNDNDTITPTYNYTYNFELGGGSISTDNATTPTATPSTSTNLTPTVNPTITPKLDNKTGDSSSFISELAPLLLGGIVLAGIGGLGYVAIDNLTGSGSGKKKGGSNAKK